MSSYESKFMLTDEQILALGVRSSDVELFRRDVYRNCFSIDTWYDNLSDFTFKTLAIDLAVEEAKTILKDHYASASMSPSTRALSPPSWQSDPVLQRLAQRIDESIKENFPNGAFIKLNTRSPKDVSVDQHNDETTQRLFEIEAKKEITKVGGDSRSITKSQALEAFVRATNKRLKITSGDDAIYLLVTSSRISEDLSKSLSFAEYRWTTKLVIREWIDYVSDHPEMEFRAFVHKNQLNAVTQYFSMMYFEELKQRKHDIKNQIVAFFEEKKKFIKHESYVVDFFVFPDKVFIIELNPFHIGAGAGLFSWKTDRDLFLNGPLDFRVVERAPPEGADYDFVPIRWQKHIQQAFDVTTPNQIRIKNLVRLFQVPVALVVLGAVGIWVAKGDWKL